MSDLKDVGQSVLNWWLRGGLAGSLGLKPADVQLAEAAQRPLNPFDLSSPVLGFGSPAIMGGERAAAGMMQRAGLAGQEAGPLQQARAMEAESGMTGATDKQIFDKTGWYRGADNKWRFVIPDKDAEFGPGIKRNYGGGEGWVGVSPNPFAYQTLGDILKHDDLYEAYPWLKNVSVQSVPLEAFAQGTKAGSAPGKIWLGPGLENDVMSNLLHEVQHQVQGYEGFAAGGDWRRFLPPGTENPTQNQMMDAYNKYLRLGGEVESRLVQEQHAQQDWSRLPWEYEGYTPKEQQIMTFRPQTNPKYQLVPVDHDPFAP